MGDYQDMQLLLRHAREETERAEAMLNKGGKCSLGEFQAYARFAMECLKAVVSISLKEGEKQK